MFAGCVAKLSKSQLRLLPFMSAQHIGFPCVPKDILDTEIFDIKRTLCVKFIAIKTATVATPAISVDMSTQLIAHLAAIRTLKCHCSTWKQGLHFRRQRNRSRLSKDIAR